MNINFLRRKFLFTEVSLSNKRSFFFLIVGLIVGFCLAQIYALWSLNRLQWMFYSGHQPGKSSDFHAHIHFFENSTVAKKLFDVTRVLCVVMTKSSNHKSQAQRVQQTWGKRCNKLLFMGSKKDDELKSIALNVSEGRNNSWAKTKAAFQYVYEYHFDDAEWFFQADDDTYVILENLRYMLYPYSAKTPIYFGCKHKPFVKQGFMTGGAAYVLSKEAVRRLLENGLSNTELCQSAAFGAEDIEIGKCLESVNVTAGDSRDEHQRGRFFPLMPKNHLIPSKMNASMAYSQHIYYQTGEGLDCCSDHAISFQVVSPNQMYLLEYFVYHVRPYGIARLYADLPERLAVNETATKPKIDIESAMSVS